MYINSLKIKNLLSFGPESAEIRLGRLNVLIGPNGSGKSNLLEILDLLRNLPRDLAGCVRRGGGINEWLWKGKSANVSAEERRVGSLSLLVAGNPNPELYWDATTHHLELTGVSSGLEILREEIRDSFSAEPAFLSENGQPFRFPKGKKTKLSGSFESNRSILEQRRDPKAFPEITRLATEYEKIKLYREYSMGRLNTLRQPQSLDGPVDFLEPDGSNLGLILNNLRRFPESVETVLGGLQELSPDFSNFHVELVANTAQIFIQEKSWSTPATRLSDGTLRYLCLLAVLCHPNPPPLICIEEPEVGLHPDLLPGLGRLLVRASQRCQLVVTTHSDILVDALSHTPESILVVEKQDGSTVIRHLTANEIAAAAEGLGKLWLSGQLGGTRW